MTGPQNYQAAERLAHKPEAHLNDGDNEGAAVWASLARTYAILASAAATTLGEWRPGHGARLPAASCLAAEPGALLRTKALEAPGRAPRRLRAGSGQGRARGSIARKPSPISRSRSIARSSNVTGASGRGRRHSDLLVTAIHARFLT